MGFQDAVLDFLLIAIVYACRSVACMLKYDQIVSALGKEGANMIPYTLNNDVRKQSTVVIVLISIVITYFFNLLAETVIDCYNLSSLAADSYLSDIISLLIGVALPPFLFFFILQYLYSRYFWKYFSFFHQIPDLNGTWKGTSRRLGNQPRNVTVTIQQDWDNIIVETKMEDSPIKSTCKCVIAGMEVNNGSVILRYAYRNTALVGTHYIGYNELDVSKDNICGTYVTTKTPVTTGIFNIFRI